MRKNERPAGPTPDAVAVRERRTLEAFEVLEAAMARRPALRMSDVLGMVFVVEVIGRVAVAAAAKCGKIGPTDSAVANRDAALFLQDFPSFNAGGWTGSGDLPEVRAVLLIARANRWVLAVLLPAIERRPSASASAERLGAVEATIKELLPAVGLDLRFEAAWRKAARRCGVTAYAAALDDISQEWVLTDHRRGWWTGLFVGRGGEFRLSTRSRAHVIARAVGARRITTAEGRRRYRVPRVASLDGAAISAAGLEARPIGLTPEQGELARLFQELRDSCTDPADCAAMAHLCDGAPRKEAARSFGVTVEQARHAERARVRPALQRIAEKHRS